MSSSPRPDWPSRRLLLVTNNRFWRGSMGSNVRVASVCEHFLRSGWEVTVAFSGRPYGTDEADVARKRARVVFSESASAAGTGGKAATTPVPRSMLDSARQMLRKAHRWLRALATQPGRMGAGLPWHAAWREVGLRTQEPRVSDGFDARYLQLIRTLTDAAPPDAVLVEYVFLAWVLPHLKPHLPQHTTWLLDTHDVMHERQQRFHAMGEVHSLDITAREEARWLSHFDAVLAIQARDAEKFRALASPAARVITVVHAMPAVKVGRVSTGPVGVGFLGSTMAPNSLALHELLHQVWPLVQAQVGSSARLVLAGSVCSELKDKLLPSGVVALGHLSELDDFYAQVDVVASPIRVGGGLKIKNVEALCRGKALVTTAIGAEGLESGAGTAYLLAERPEDMVAALVRLLSKPQVRLALSEAGFAYASQVFSSQAAYAELDTFLYAAEARRRASDPIKVSSRSSA